MFTEDSYAIFRPRHAVGRKKVDTDVLFSRASEVEFLGRHFVCIFGCKHDFILGELLEMVNFTLRHFN